MHALLLIQVLCSPLQRTHMSLRQARYRERVAASGPLQRALTALLHIRYMEHAATNSATSSMHLSVLHHRIRGAPYSPARPSRCITTSTHTRATFRHRSFDTLTSYHVRLQVSAHTQRVLSGEELQQFVDQTGRDFFGVSRSEAYRTGLCIDCKQEARRRIYSKAGEKEYTMSGMCERCFDIDVGYVHLSFMSPSAAADCPQFTTSFAFVFRSSSRIEINEEQRQQYDIRPDRLTLGTSCCKC